jgi:hypothetical protein
MATWYVSDTGLDTNSGLTLPLAFATVNKAVSVAAGGDTIIVAGILHQTVSITTSYSAAAPLTIIAHPSLGGTIDGQFSLPTGAVAYTNPNDGTVSTFAALVVITGNHIVWSVDVKNSRGRGIRIGDDAPATPNTNVTLQDCWVDYCRNSCIYVVNCGDITLRRVTWSHAGSYYQEERAPSTTYNWPGALAFVTADGYLVEECYGFENWGEGFIHDKGSTLGIVRYTTLRDNMSVGLYCNRATQVAYYGNLIYNTDTFISPAQGIAVQNEANTAQFGNVDGVDIYNNISVGHNFNLVIGSGQGTNDPISNVRVAFNTLLGAQPSSPSDTSWGAMRLVATNHVNITIYGNLIYQSDGEWGSYSGDNSTYVKRYNSWSGSAVSVPSFISHSTDVADFLITDVTPAFTGENEDDLGPGETIPDANREADGASFVPTTEVLVPLLTGLEDEDFFGAARGSGNWQVGAVNFGLPEEPEPPPTGTSSITQSRTAANITPGSQTFPYTGLTGQPVLYEYEASYALTDNTAADHAILSIGAADGTRQWAIAQRIRHGVTPSVASRSTVNDAVVLLKNTTSTSTIGRLSHVSGLSTGVTANWTTAPGSAYLVKVTAYAVPSAYTACVTLPTAINTAVTITCGFAPQVVILHTTARNVFEAGNADFLMSSGFASYRNATLTQMSYIMRYNNGTTTNASASYLSTAYIGGIISAAGALTTGLEIANITSTGLDLYLRLGGPQVTPSVAGVTILSFGDLDHWLGLLPMRTSAIPHTWTDAGFQPGFVKRILTLAQIANVATVSADAGAMAWASTTPFNAYSTSVAVELAGGASDAQSLSDDTSINLPLDTGVATYIASHGGFTATGATDDYSLASAPSRFQIVLAVEAAGVELTLTAADAVASTAVSIVKGAFSFTPTAADATASTSATFFSQTIYTFAANDATASTSVTFTKGAFSFTPTAADTVASTVNPTLTALNLGGRVLHTKRRSFTIRTPKRINMSSLREIKESPVEQGVNEQVSWILDTTNWGGSPTSPTNALEQERTVGGNLDLSDTNLSGTATVSGNYISSETVSALTRGKYYRLEFLWTDPDGNAVEAYVRILGTE